MTNPPQALDRRTLLALFDACQVEQEYPDGSADVRIDGALWPRIKRVAMQRATR